MEVCLKSFYSLSIFCLLLFFTGQAQAQSQDCGTSTFSTCVSLPPINVPGAPYPSFGGDPGRIGGDDDWRNPPPAPTTPIQRINESVFRVGGFLRTFPFCTNVVTAGSGTDAAFVLGVMNRTGHIKKATNNQVVETTFGNTVTICDGTDAADAVPHNGGYWDIYLCPASDSYSEGLLDMLLIHELAHIFGGLQHPRGISYCTQYWLEEPFRINCHLNFPPAPPPNCPRPPQGALNLRDLNVTFASAVFYTPMVTTNTIYIQKTGGNGEIKGAYGNPICPPTNPNNCTSVVETGRNISFSVIPDPGYKFVGWSGDSACSNFGQQLYPVTSDLHCTATFAVGTAAPSLCMEAGSVCDVSDPNDEMISECNKCCEYSPQDPYISNYTPYGYVYTCRGTPLSKTSANLALNTNIISNDNPINVAWANGNPATYYDWIGLYRLDQGQPTPPDVQFVDYAYAGSCTRNLPTSLTTTGSCVFKNLLPGTYEFRMFSNNHFIKIGTSTTFTVLASSNTTSLSFSKVEGGGETATEGSIRLFKIPGLYVLQAQSDLTAVFKGAAGGGQGGYNSGAIGGAGGGAGAVTRGTEITLLAGHSYSLVVGVGGNYAGSPIGQATTLIDTTTNTTLVSLGGGGAGGSGQVAGVGGTVGTGSNGYPGGHGGYGGINAGAGAATPAWYSTSNGAGAGGGGGYLDAGNPGNPGAAGGVGGLAPNYYLTSGNTQFGGRGGNGGGASFTEVDGSYGFGGGGAGGGAGAGMVGGNGVGILIFQ